MKLRNLLSGQVRRAHLSQCHAACSYGQAVVVLKGGRAVDPLGWQIVALSERERARLPLVWRQALPRSTDAAATP
jgi:hypothetical protein